MGPEFAHQLWSGRGASPLIFHLVVRALSARPRRPPSLGEFAAEGVQMSCLGQDDAFARDELGGPGGHRRSGRASWQNERGAIIAHDSPPGFFSRVGPNALQAYPSWGRWCDFLL